jgi:hypothetical protein
MDKHVLRVLELAAQIKGKDGGVCRHEILPQAAQALLARAAQWGAG